MLQLCCSSKNRHWTKRDWTELAGLLQTPRLQAAGGAIRSGWLFRAGDCVKAAGTAGGPLRAWLADCRSALSYAEAISGSDEKSAALNARLRRKAGERSSTGSRITESTG